MMGQMLMGLLGIMVFQFLSLLAGGVAGADKRLGESKLLESFQSGAVHCYSGSDWLLLECGGFDCCMLV
jgi:hypothetical protein